MGEVIWLIALLANQEILIHNLQHRDEPKPLLTEDEIELLTNPYELTEVVMIQVCTIRPVMREILPSMAGREQQHLPVPENLENFFGSIP